VSSSELTALRVLSSNLQLQGYNAVVLSAVRAWQPQKSVGFAFFVLQLPSGVLWCCWTILQGVP